MIGDAVLMCVGVYQCLGAGSMRIASYLPISEMLHPYKTPFLRHDDGFRL
jgi:hypothetical protein